VSNVNDVGGVADATAGAAAITATTKPPAIASLRSRARMGPDLETIVSPFPGRDALAVLASTDAMPVLMNWA
jgi:hypothetical protein